MEIHYSWMSVGMCTFEVSTTLHHLTLTLYLPLIINPYLFVLGLMWRRRRSLRPEALIHRLSVACMGTAPCTPGCHGNHMAPTKMSRKMGENTESDLHSIPESIHHANSTHPNRTPYTLSTTTLTTKKNLVLFC